jgi:hypothetical protein
MKKKLKKMSLQKETLTSFASYGGAVKPSMTTVTSPTVSYENYCSESCLYCC